MVTVGNRTAGDSLRAEGGGLRFSERPPPSGLGVLALAEQVGHRVPTGFIDRHLLLHVEATDEASHEGDAKKKIEALERIDADIVGPVRAFLQSQGGYRLLVCPDHPTFLRTKTHSHGPVPFALCGTDVTPDNATTYDERAAAHSTLSFPGHELMPFFLGG